MNLSCPHAYCHACVIGLRKTSAASNVDPPPLASSLSDSVNHTSRVHQANQRFVCAICRQESMGYVRHREIDHQLNSLEASCPHCSQVLVLRRLRTHLETCLPVRRVEGRAQTDASLGQPVKTLSKSQVDALKKAQAGENRSTFPCPFCARSK